MPRFRPRSNTVSSLTGPLDADDPLMHALQPPINETASEREERLRTEREAKRISDEIDEELRRERAALKKKKPVRLLLLGQSESGKSTTLKSTCGGLSNFKFPSYLAPRFSNSLRAASMAGRESGVVYSYSAESYPFCRACSGKYLKSTWRITYCVW